MGAIRGQASVLDARLGALVGGIAAYCSWNVRLGCDGWPRQRALRRLGRLILAGSRAEVWLRGHRTPSSQPAVIPGAGTRGGNAVFEDGYCRCLARAIVRGWVSSCRRPFLVWRTR